MPYDETTADRIRLILSGRRVEEKKMFGGICFMLDGHMCCGVRRATIMVRVGRDNYEATLKLKDVSPLGTNGRRLTGFVVVEAPAYRTEAALAKWVACGVETVATLPPRA